MARLQPPSSFRWLLPVLLLAGIARTVPEDAGLPCLPAGPDACASCHLKDLQVQFPAHRARPCTRYCMTCHFKDAKEPHHPVGSALRKKPGDARLVTGSDHMGCSTCHDLSTPRHDRVRWRAESLYDRLFRSQAQYKTYQLVYRNDRGQLCLACH